jgi:23S rRNA (cytosine1962-C5)-methyltransferase
MQAVSHFRARVPGRRKVTAIEINEDCVAQLHRNAARNTLTIVAQPANAFDMLHDLERHARNTTLSSSIPPSFTKTKGKLHDAARGYKEIHLRALQLLAPDGLLADILLLVPCHRGIFKEVIKDAAVDAKKTLRQLATYSQGLDHPIIPTLPETEYLKGFLFELAQTAETEDPIPGSGSRILHMSPTLSTPRLFRALVWVQWRSLLARIRGVAAAVAAPALSSWGHSSPATSSSVTCCSLGPRLPLQLSLRRQPALAAHSLPDLRLLLLSC